MKWMAQLNALQNRVDARSLRERGILFLLLSALLYMLVDAALIQPQERQQKQLLGELAAIRAEIATMEREALKTIEHAGQDADTEERQQLAQLELADQALQQKIREAVSGLIEPQEMARALERVLQRQPGLTFVRIENLGARPLLEQTLAEAALPDAGIYKHTMRLELEGDFTATLGYLRALEALPWEFNWQGVSLEMLEYPRARVVITVNTLSLSEGWIGV